MEKIIKLISDLFSKTNNFSEILIILLFCILAALLVAFYREKQNLNTRFAQKDTDYKELIERFFAIETQKNDYLVKIEKELIELKHCIHAEPAKINEVLYKLDLHKKEIESLTECMKEQNIHITNLRISFLEQKNK